MDFPEFRRLLIAERGRRSLSQRRLARLVGVSDAAVVFWENGDRIPSRKNAQKWADVLEVQLPDDTTGWFNRETHARRAPCGTRSGYERHRRAGEDTCPECKTAIAAWWRGYRAQKKAQTP